MSRKDYKFLYFYLFYYYFLYYFIFFFGLFIVYFFVYFNFLLLQKINTIENSMVLNILFNCIINHYSFSKHIPKLYFFIANDSDTAISSIYCPLQFVSFTITPFSLLLETNLWFAVKPYCLANSLSG